MREWSRPGEFAIRVGMMALLGAGSLSAAGPAGEATPKVTSPASAANEPVVFTVKPAMRFPAVLPPAQSASDRALPPPPLDAERRAALVERAFGGQPGATIALSARQPFDPAIGHLTFDLPHRFDPVHGVGFRADSAGSAGVSLHTEQGRSYLLDYAVNSWGEGVYTVEADGNAQEVPDDGNLSHVLVGIQATAGGWITVRLRRSGSGFYLHGVEVTPVQAAE